MLAGRAMRLHSLFAVSQADAVFLDLQSALAGRYSLLAELGRGGMGIVYLAREVRLDRLVAMKVLPPTRSTPVARERFLREARTAAKLSHPGIVPIHTVDEVGDFVFIAMGYVDGESLRARVAARGRLPASEAARTLKEIAWALAYAHAQGVVHRDIKPDNILLERGTGRALVADFGIAHLDGASEITTAGQVLGTPEYMSPEQASGQPMDGRSDIYALGAVGYLALSGRPPFTAPTVSQLLAQQITQPAAPLLSVATDVPPKLAQVVDRCLMKTPAERFASAEEVAEAVEAAVARPESLPQPLERWVHSVDQARLGQVLLLPLFIYPAMALLDLLLQTLGMHYAFFQGVTFSNWLGYFVPFVLPFAVYGLARWRDVRAVLGQGYRSVDLQSALATEAKRLAAEQREDRRGDRRWAAGARRVWNGLPGALIACIGVVTVGQCYNVRESDAGILLIGAWLALAGAVMLGRSLGPGRPQSDISDLRARQRLWSGKLGSWLEWVATLGLRRGEHPAAGHRPTEFALGSAAAAVFEALPKEVRRELHDIPAVIRDLEDRAQIQRARADAIARLEAAESGGAERLGNADVVARREALRADLRRQSEAAERRLSEVVTALETIRLDLLRLSAGAITAASVSADIAVVAEVGAEVDAALAARREVNALLQPDDRPQSAERGPTR